MPAPDLQRSLRELAQQRRLPAHQPMDPATLAWIESNRPVDFHTAPSFPRPGQMPVPPASWFTDEQQAESNHGIRHNARVSLYAALLAEECRLDADDVAAACAAGAVHDCRRRDDRADPGHGRRAAAWFHRHADAVTSALGHTLPPAAPHRTALAIAPHDIPYDHFTAAQDRSYGSAPHLVDVLKAADGLDRYRFPLKRWWPDLAQLRLPLPAWMAPATFALVVASERAWLDGAASADALATAHQMLTRGQKEARAWAATSTPRTPTTPARWSRGRACPKGAGASGPGAGWRGAVEWRAAPGQPAG